MSPLIAQLLVAAVQAIFQAIESKLAHEERILLLLDPDDLADVEDRSALERLTARARLVKHFGRESEAHENSR